MTENWRVNTARFFAGAALSRDLPRTALAAAGAIRVTWICSRRSIATTPSLVSPARSPATISPVRVRPENANVGICPRSSEVLRPRGRTRPAGLAPETRRRERPRRRG